MVPVPRWIRRIDSYFGQDGWSLIAFQPILYLFILGAALRLWINQDEPINFNDVVIEGFYPVWLALGIGGPVLALISWYMIQKCSGRISFIGLWLRLSADIQVFTVVLTYHIQSASRFATESRIFSRYIVGATLIFLVCLMIRDAWVLFITERLASRIHRGVE